VARELSDRAPFLGWLIVGYVALALLVVALAAADVGVLDLFRDAPQLSDYIGNHPWKGAFSMVGVFAWVGAATLFLLTGAVLRSRDGPTDRSWFFLAGGGVFLLAGIDDGFVVHDNLAEVVLGHDVAEPIIFAGLSLLILAWAVRFRREILDTCYVILGLAALGLGVPFLLDFRHLLDVNPGWWWAIEEPMELAGVLTLLVYAAIESFRALVPAGGARPAQPSSG
jgi:hypothetical protein